MEALRWEPAGQFGAAGRGFAFIGLEQPAGRVRRRHVETPPHRSLLRHDQPGQRSVSQDQRSERGAKQRPRAPPAGCACTIAYTSTEHRQALDTSS